MCSGGRPSLSPSTAPISRSGIVDAVDRAPADRLVAVERERPALADQQPGQQAHQRARVEHVDRAVRRAQAAQAAAVHAQARRGLVEALDARAERLDRRQRGERVGVGAEAA